jgi:hypothetical protein
MSTSARGPFPFDEMCDGDLKGKARTLGFLEEEEGQEPWLARDDDEGSDSDLADLERRGIDEELEFEEGDDDEDDDALDLDDIDEDELSDANIDDDVDDLDEDDEPELEDFSGNRVGHGLETIPKPTDRSLTSKVTLATELSLGLLD